MKNKITVGEACSITTGKLDSNAACLDGEYPFFTCAKEPVRIDHACYDADVILVAGNNAAGNFHLNRFKGKFNAYQRTYILTSKGKHDLDFVFYALKTLLQSLKEKAQGSQTKFLTRPLLEDLAFKSLGEDTERKVAKTLSHLDEKIELNNRINAELESLAKLLYDYWFVQFDFPMTAEQAAAHGDPTLTGKPYKSSGGKMTHNKTLNREIPGGWKGLYLPDVMEALLSRRGKSPEWSQNLNDIVVLSAKHVKNGKLVSLEKANHITREFFENWMPNPLQDGDILMTSEAPAGEFYYIQDDDDYSLGQRLFAIRAAPKIITSGCLYFELSHGFSYRHIMAGLSGSTVFGISQDALLKIPVTVADRETQNAFTELVLPKIKQIKNLTRQNQELAALRDWLLPMLMNGQVTVQPGGTD